MDFSDLNVIKNKDGTFSYDELGTFGDSVGHGETRFDDKLSCDEYFAKSALSDTLVTSENDLSARFDALLSDSEGRFDFEDEIAMREEFNNYADSMATDGELGNAQYSCYQYVGVYF